jgi:hypothetical protein
MGDISRHRDIFFNTQDAIPTALLGKCKLTVADLTYLEMGNYLTDVSQFRDPVTYIFAKQRIWREFVLPKAADKALLARVMAAMAGYVSLAASQTLKELLSGKAKSIANYAGPGLAGLSLIPIVLPTDTYAGLDSIDEWIDRMFGTPIELRIRSLKNREEQHYGLVGEFFKYFIKGITHLLFAAEVPNKVPGDWAKINRIPEATVSAVFEEFFTQYYPHEHTDQPPYIWDASKRPDDPMYQPSGRQRNLVDKNVGVMNAVDEHYVQYLSEGLSDLEQEWRTKLSDPEAQRNCLVRMGKLLHGVEDWYFHSNVVELIQLRGHKPAQRDGEDDEKFARRFVQEVFKNDPVFMKATGEEKAGLQRRLYRRLRFPAYDPGDKIRSGGILSKKRMSTLSLHHAYPAFPSQQDTAHTLLHALGNLERKVEAARHKKVSGLPPWLPCVLKNFIAEGGDVMRLVREKAQARGVSETEVLADLAPGIPTSDRVLAVWVDVLRELLPLVLTLLDESERQRLIADVDPLQWPGGPMPEHPGETERDNQLERHRLALKPKKSGAGLTEDNNYQRAARYLVDCGYLNAPGQEALVTAFNIDQKSEELHPEAPGAGGFLIKFALELQQTLDEGDKATRQLNDIRSIFDQRSDNGAFNEIVGSHSLMSKDTLASSPFFDDAKVLASVASLAVFHIMLERISAPAGDRRLPWKLILQYFIRYPVKAGGWERRAIAFFRDPKNTQKKPPRYADLPELGRVVESALNSPAALDPWRKGTKATELEEKYVKLELGVSKYRYP